jgi:pilus retraction protein PilT
MERVLRLMAERGASDVYLAVNTPILIRIDGQIVQLSEQLIAAGQMRNLLAEVLKPGQLDELDQHRELNTGIGLPGVGSFRISAFQQRGTLAAVLRCIPGNVPVPEELGLPRGLSDLVLEKRGLVLMAGATGTGKSTTLASMLEWRNQQMTGHILTIEDPIEFLFTNKRSIINQREVGRDTESLQTALRNALRQAPDCILIGEIRDRETMSAALSMALSGHLVLATLHANNSVHALGRIRSVDAHDACHRVATAAACAGRRAHAGRGDAAQHQARVGDDRARGLHGGQGGDGVVDGAGFPDLRAGPDTPGDGGPRGTGRGGGLRRLSGQPDVEASEPGHLRRRRRSRPAGRSARGRASRLHRVHRRRARSCDDAPARVAPAADFGVSTASAACARLLT